MTLQQEKIDFQQLLEQNQEWLMHAILGYAERNDFTKYTSTLQEAWRVSIEGLSRSLAGMLDLYQEIPELHPDEDYSQDPAARFGMAEAQKHRERGVNLAMFLGLMKYYRQCYKELLKQHRQGFEHADYFEAFVERFFDRTEIAYCSEWAGLDSEKQIQALSATNLRMTNEKNKYLTTFVSFGSPVILLDKDGYIENMNAIAALIFKGQEVSGAYYYAQEREQERFPWIDKELNAMIVANKVEADFEKRYEASGGERYIFGVKIKKLPDISRKYIGYTVLMNDITGLRETQERLIVTEKMAALGGMVAGVAHEVNTPVGIGVSAVTHLQEKTRRLQEQYHSDDLSEEEFEGYLDSVEELTDLTYTNLRRAADLVRNFKQVAVDQSVEATRDFELKEYTEGVLLSLKNHLKKTRIQIELACPEALLIHNYPGVFSQIITNLVLNSLTHGFEQGQEGRIGIEISSDEEALMLRYSDTGKGMDEETQRRAFDPFYTTNRGGGNSGLGLHILYKLITDKLDGEIKLQSEPGQGVTFIMRMPCNQSNDHPGLDD